MMMDLQEKLRILTEGAKYDVACTSSGVNRGAEKGKIGSAVHGGICHTFTADGRCVSLLKILMTNACKYDCLYCVNRSSNDIERATLTPREIAELTIDFYRRNYIEGLFLSSGVIKNPDHTTELLIAAVTTLRREYHFNGYIHVKAIPGTDPALVQALGHVVDRMSVNIELPSASSLAQLAPEKTRNAVLTPMKFISGGIKANKEELTLFQSAKPFVPAGQATQMIVGATPDSDAKIVHLAQGLYKSFNLKRVFYSAYVPVNTQSNLPAIAPPLLREHRLYQADWLLRFYKFTAGELFQHENENLSLHMDPKCHWAINHLDEFPVEINKADYDTLLRVPGIGQKSAERIVKVRKVSKLDFVNLKKIGCVLKRAKYFITCDGKMMDKFPFLPDIIEMRLTDEKSLGSYGQMTLGDVAPKLLEGHNPSLLSNSRDYHPKPILPMNNIGTTYNKRLTAQEEFATRMALPQVPLLPDANCEHEWVAAS